VAQLKNGLSGSQGENGACRSEGLERLVAGQHVPDRLGQLASELDLRDLRATLAAQAALGALVALLVERVRGRGDRRLHQSLQIQPNMQHNNSSLHKQDEQDQPGPPRTVSQGRSFVSNNRPARTVTARA